MALVGEPPSDDSFCGVDGKEVRNGSQIKLAGIIMQDQSWRCWKLVQVSNP